MENIKYHKFKNKYQKHGAYHWSWYKWKKSYRDYVHFLKDWIKEKSVLDIGAGDGLITSVLGIRGIDSDPEGIKAAKTKGVDIDLGDAYNLPYNKEEFDSVLMSHTYEHLEFPLKALEEARRVLKNFLYIVVPEIETYFKTNQESLSAVVCGTGFKTEEIFTKDKIVYGKFKKI